MFGRSDKFEEADNTSDALGDEVLACVSEKIPLRVQIKTLQAEIARLKAPPKDDQPKANTQ